MFENLFSLSSKIDGFFQYKNNFVVYYKEEPTPEEKTLVENQIRNIFPDINVIHLVKPEVYVVK